MVQGPAWEKAKTSRSDLQSWRWSSQAQAATECSPSGETLLAGSPSAAVATHPSASGRTAASNEFSRGFLGTHKGVQSCGRLTDNYCKRQTSKSLRCRLYTDAGTFLDLPKRAFLHQALALAFRVEF